MERIDLIKEEVVQILKEKSRICPACGSKTTHRKDKNEMARCSWSKCMKTFSIFKDTPFFRTKKKLLLFLRISECWLYNMKMMAKMLLVDPKTIKRILKSMFRRLIPAFYRSLPKLGGLNRIVEVDESKFGKRKYNRGRRIEGAWIIGFLERGEHVILLPIDKRCSMTLKKYLKKYIKRESTIYSDCWKGYIWAKSHFRKHLTVNHSKEFVNASSGCHINGIEGIWSAVKSTIPKQCRSKKRIVPYLIRYMILKNEREDPLKALINYLFYFLLLKHSSRKTFEFLGVKISNVFFYTAF